MMRWRICKCGHRRGLHDRRRGGSGCGECEMKARADGTRDNTCGAFAWRWGVV